MQLYWTVILIVMAAQVSNSNMLHTLQHVIAIADWNNFVILHDCDVESSVDQISFPKPATYYSSDLKDANALFEFFQVVSKTAQLNLLVFCSNCTSLLRMINEFESSYQMHGYYTHFYQWIFVTNFTQTRSEFENHVRNVTNLAVLDVGTNNIYAIMFGNNKRYFDLVTSYIKHRTDIFPNLQYGFNGAKLQLCTLPWEPFIIKANEWDIYWLLY